MGAMANMGTVTNMGAVTYIRGRQEHDPLFLLFGMVLPAGFGGYWIKFKIIGAKRTHRHNYIHIFIEKQSCYNSVVH